MKRSFLKRISFLVLTLLVTAALFAGGGQEEAEDTRTERVVVRALWQEIDPPSVSFIYNLEKQFEEENPGIDVSLEFISPNNVSTKVTSVVAAGGGLEMANLDGATSGRLAGAGRLYPSDSIIEALEGDEFFPSTLLRSEGTYYGVPFVGESFVLWYRKDLLEEAGIDPPETWDDWLAAAEALTVDKDGDGNIDQYGMVLPASEHVSTAIWFEHFLALNGKNIFDRDLNVNLVSPRTREALEFYTELAQYAPPQISSWQFFEMIDAFTTGQVAMTMYTGRVLSRIYQGAPDLIGKVGAVTLPYNRMRAYHQGVSYNVVFESARDPEAASKWVEFMTRPENAAPFFLTVPGHLVPVTRAQQEYLLTQDNQIISENPEIVETLFDVLEYGINDIVNGVAINEEDLTIEDTGIFNPYWGVQRSTLALPRAIQAILYNGESADRAMRRAAQEIEDAVEEARRTIDQ
jgi:multiple sugar transport system substrate-binding protein